MRLPKGGRIGKSWENIRKKILRLRLTGQIERHGELLADDAGKIFHVSGKIHAFAVTQIEMTLVFAAQNGMALHAKLQIQRS